MVRAFKDVHLSYEVLLSSHDEQSPCPNLNLTNRFIALFNYNTNAVDQINFVDRPMTN